MHRSKTQSRNPSFSSSLLDEIYNSIDPKTHKTQPFLNSVNTTTKKQSISVTTRGRRDRLFGSMSSSSDSNSSIFSSSDTELTHPKKTTSSRPLCFGPSKTKPRKTEDNNKALFRQNRAFRVSDDYDYASDVPKITRYDEDWESARTMRSKKSSSDLKKPKTPASPGVRIVNFINSLFSNNGSSKQSSSAVKSYPRKIVTKQTDYHYPSTTCSSASSFSRSCLNKNSEKPPSDRIKRSVRFSPVNVIVTAEEEEEDYLNNGYIRKSVRKSVEDGGRRSVEEIAREFLRDYHKNHENSLVKNNGFEDYGDEDDDVASDSSSDLFELDLGGNHHHNHNLYGDELPVYETTFAGLIL
ncbi:Protein BIG GRAIN 1-like D [Hirschfeldia incana]|nr:Protein BIG GRAIN 1-like D [Hirschfeldia incana]